LVIARLNLKRNLIWLSISPELAMHKLGNSLLPPDHLKGREGVSLPPGYRTTIHKEERWMILGD
jgi:hypothetical protein